MQLIRYHTTNGYRMAIVAREGSKWLYLLLMGDARLTKVPKTESRYFTDWGEPTQKQIKTFNRAARKAGYSRRTPILH